MAVVLGVLLVASLALPPLAAFPLAFVLIVALACRVFPRRR